MKAEKNLWMSWKVKYSHDDIQLIADQSEIHRNTIASALKFNSMSEKTFNAIKKYFATKTEKVLK